MAGMGGMSPGMNLDSGMMLARGSRGSGRSEFSRRSEREAEARLNEQLRIMRSPAMHFPGEVSLDEVLTYVAHHVEKSLNTPVGIFSDPSDPDTNISNPDALKSIKIADLEFPEGTLSIAELLDEIARRAPEPKLTWDVRGGRILIMTVEHSMSEEKLRLRSYEIGHLRGMAIGDYNGEGMAATGKAAGMAGEIGRMMSDGTDGGMGMPPGSGAMQAPSGMGGLGGGGLGGVSAGSSWSDSLMNSIIELSSTGGLWKQDGGAGTMAIAGSKLLVRQTREGHERVVEVLEQLEAAAEGSGGNSAGPYRMGGMAPGMGMPGMGGTMGAAFGSGRVGMPGPGGSKGGPAGSNPERDPRGGFRYDGGGVGGGGGGGGRGGGGSGNGPVDPNSAPLNPRSN
jgi:hypothetical protein